ncbi:MAG: lectin-like domain-containing protein, partial [Clostridia bacterium]
MKKIKQILGVVAVFLLVVGCYSQTLQAKELTNSEMIEDSNMELYGQAKFLDDDSIQLTPLETNSSGCVWYPHSVDTTQDFSITVSYWIGGGRELPYEGADGMILGFTEKKGIGSNGEYQGFVSGEKSYGVELDSYPYNRGDPDGKHIAIIKNNVRNHLKYVLDDRVDDSAWHKLSVSYKAKEKTLTVYLDEKEVLASDGIELSQKCYLGISAATASGCNQHLIKNISIDGKIGQGRKIKYSIKDTYSFVNLTDKIPEKIYTKKFGQLLGRALRTIHDGTAGQCYGMAATVAASAEYNSPAASSYVDESNKKVENLFDVKPDMKSLQSKVTASEYIKCAFLEQIKPGALSQRLFSVNQLNKLYNKVKENVYNDGEPVIIEIQDGGGHALLATGTGEDTEEQTEILVYDCNYPKTMRSLYLLKNEKGKYKGWQYKTPYKEYSGGENYLGGLYDDKYISYNTTTKKVIQSFENYKGGKKEKIDTYALIKPSKTKDDIELLKGYKGSLELEKIGKDESIIPISVVTGNSDDCVGQYYWVNNDKIKFKSNTENSSYVITSENIEVGMAVPKNSEATVDISKKNTPVSLKLSGDRKFEIEYTTTDNKENIILYKIQGIGGEEVSCEKNGSEIDITGVKNIETTISIGDKEISKNNISDLSEGDTYILNVNDNTFRRTEKIENNNVNAKVKVGKIKLLGVSKKISEGKKIVLKTVISPNNASNKTIVWKSSNPKVATVTQSGIVTMKKKTGGKKVAITAIATDGSNKYASWKITSMKGVVKKVKINGKKRIKAGKTLKLKAKILATKHANKKLLWKSNNSKLATVNQKGVVKVHK